jgi:uncharacterized protein YdhG (YjbR/CyaY superfamily)
MKASNERQKELQRIRALAKKLVPTAEETIMHGMPTLKYRGLAAIRAETKKRSST